MPTEWERKTRNRVLRTLRDSCNVTEELWKQLRKTREPKLVAAITVKAASKLRAQAQELEDCARDLGYEPTTD